MKEVIHTDKAPAAVGPYSQAIKAGSTIYTSGQIGLIPETGEFAGTTIEEQTRQVFKNLQNVLAAAGATLDDAVKVCVFLDKISDFGTVNTIYAEYFTGAFPARSAMEVANLPKGALVEIEVVAVVD